jgi:hypothetical protein
VEVIPNKVLRNRRDLACDSTKAKSFSYLVSLVCSGRTNCSLDEAMLKTIPSISASLLSQCEQNLDYLVRLALLVMKNNETEFAFSILLAILKAGVDLQLVTFCI